MNIAPPNHASDRAGGPEPDEASLGELWSMIVVRWRAVASLALVGVAASVAAAYLYQPRFTFSSSIEIGQLSAAGGLIDSPDTIVAKLEETYVPQAQAEYVRAHPSDAHLVPNVQARVPKGSQLVVVESRGPAATRPTHELIHRLALDLLARDHARALVARRGALESQQYLSRQKLEAAGEQVESLKAGSKRIDATRELLKREIAELRGSLAQAVRDRSDAMRGAASESRMLSVMILDQEILKTQDRLAAMEERFFVALDGERSANDRASADAKRSQAAELQVIEQTERDLASLRETRALAPTRQSADSFGPSRLAVAALGSLAGLLLGVLVAVVLGLTRRGHAVRQGA
jgi:hypothetical protein